MLFAASYEASTIPLLSLSLAFSYDNFIPSPSSQAEVNEVSPASGVNETLVTAPTFAEKVTGTIFPTGAVVVVSISFWQETKSEASARPESIVLKIFFITQTF